MAELFADRFGGYNILVCEIRQGIIKADMTSGVTEKYDKRIFETDLCVLKRWGMPEGIR